MVGLEHDPASYWGFGHFSGGELLNFGRKTLGVPNFIAKIQQKCSCNMDPRILIINGYNYFFGGGPVGQWRKMNGDFSKGEITMTWWFKITVFY